MSKFKVRHVTVYNYETPVRDSANLIMLYPINDEFQRVVSHQLRISGSPAVEIHTDFFSNQIGTFTNTHPHQQLVIDSILEVETFHRELPTSLSSITWEDVEKTHSDWSFLDFLKQERFDQLESVQALVQSYRTSNLLPYELATTLSRYVFESFTYQKGITTVETTIDEIWKLRSGVCQDFAHMLLAMLRLCGIPARYVSGYICPNKKGMRGEGATHAWVEAYLPGFGWLGLDPTNNCIANDTHVRLAVGKNFSDCSPVRGTYRGTSNHTLEVSVVVSYEDGSISEEDARKAITTAAPATSVYKNSFRRFQEMQMQQ